MVVREGSREFGQIGIIRDEGRGQVVGCVKGFGWSKKRDSERWRKPRVKKRTRNK